MPAIPTPDFFPNDLGFFADSIIMADAIRRSDNHGFAWGIQRFYGALNQMRADGSFPLAAQLSACSATYSDVTILHLVSMAEMAATQGYDLWSMSVNGRTLETAIEFLLNAYQNPNLLYQYSKAGGGACFEGNTGRFQPCVQSRQFGRFGLGGALSRALSVFPNGSAAANDPGF